MSATMILVNLLGAVALLLWGMRMVRTGVQRAYGGGLRQFLGRWLSNRIAAFAAGFGITSLLQSSTATCLMTADFAARGFVGLSVALAIMLGADVGTSVVAQVFSLDISWLSPILILLGFVVFTSSATKKNKSLGRVALGLGLVLMALKLIVGVSEPLRNSPTILTVISALNEPVLALIIAALLTWAAHSSLAIVLLVCSLAGNGAIPMLLAMTLVLGANVGGALPPIMATWNTAPSGRRVAFGNGLFKIVGVVIALPLLASIQPYLMQIDSNPVRALVNFHTAFNLGLAIIFIPLTGLIASLMMRLVPDESSGAGDPVVRYLDMSMPVDIDVGFGNAAREVLRMGDVLDDMLERTALVLKSSDKAELQQIATCGDKVDELYSAVKIYLTEIRKEPLDDAESRRCGDIMAFCANLEHIGDIIDKNLLETAGKRIRRQLSFSSEGVKELEEIHRRVHENLRLAMAVFISGEKQMARKLMHEKEAFRELEKRASDSHMERFQEGRPETLETSSLHLDIIRDLKRINSHITSVAYPILEQAGELRSSRMRSSNNSLKSVENTAD